MLFLVGLGNPGREYDGTRHNVGYEVVAELAERHGFPSSRKFDRNQISRGRIRGQEVMLVQPTTYMNASGEAVREVMRFHKAAIEELVVVHDDLDFEPGQVRVKVGGGHGGHNGLRSIMSHLGREFVRVRVGIGKPRSTVDGSDFVLSPFDKSSRVAVDEAIEEAATAIEMIIEKGVRAAMNRVNRRPAPDSEEEAT